MKPVVTLSTRDVPFSKDFVKFTHGYITSGGIAEGDWHVQQGEKLADYSQPVEESLRQLREILSDKRGAAIAARSRALFRELLTGRPDEARKIVAKLHFVFVIGIPRTGGTYLVKQLFRAAGVDYRAVSPGLAHDGFPDFGHPELAPAKHSAAGHLMQLAEYLTMADLYFTDARAGADGRRLVPKKLTKGVYDFAAIRSLFGDRATYLITLRPPLEMIRSALDKSGGLPEGGRFAVRSAIEGWALNEQLLAGRKREEALAAEYWQVMLDYWRRYHLMLAASGAATMPTTRLARFGESDMPEAVSALCADLGVGLTPEPFAPNTEARFPSRLKARAAKTVNGVKAAWRQYGAELPL